MKTKARKTNTIARLTQAGAAGLSATTRGRARCVSPNKKAYSRRQGKEITCD